MFYQLKTLLKSRWGQVLILLGIFVILWQPKATIQSPNNIGEQSIDVKSWFKDIPLDEEGKAIVVMKEQMEKQGITEVSQMEQYESPQMTRKKLEYNKSQILAEACRQEPDLKMFSVLDVNRDDSFPTIDYVVSVLEQKYDKQTLYSDIEKGVKIIMNYIGR